MTEAAHPTAGPRRGLGRLPGTKWQRAGILVLGLIVAWVSFFYFGRPSVWVDNRSTSAVTFFVTHGGAGAAGWYQVPAHTVAHAGSDGLGSPDVRVNALGWDHVAHGTGPCSPSDYDDTIYNMPRFASVELQIDASGRPSVSLAPEPPNLPHLAPDPVGNLPEAQRC
jgi:hypothetical protein